MDWDACRFARPRSLNIDSDAPAASRMFGKPKAQTTVLSRYEKIARIGAASFFILIVLAYFALIGIGQWQADEFADFARSERPFTAFFDRLAWSPRPLSESLFALYGRLTLELKHPLTGGFLGLLWIVFLLAGLAARFGDDHRNIRDRPGFCEVAFTGLALIAAFLTSNRLTEVFYWPAGAVAYLPTLSASLFVFLYVAQGALDSSKGRLRCGVALVCAALCSETGAFFAVSYAIVAIALEVVRQDRRHTDPWGPRPFGWVLLPGICGALVLITAWLNRYRMSEPVPAELSATIGHPAASLAAALSHLATTMLGPGQQQHGWIVLNLEFFSIAFLAAGISLHWSRIGPISPRRRRDIICLAAAFLLASLLTLIATYIHHGLAVGERHDVLVRCWARLAAACAAILVAGSPRLQRVREHHLLQACAPVCLIVGVAVLWHVAPLMREYRAYGAVYRTIRANFNSGFASGSEPIEWLLPPNRGVITPAAIEPGTYSRDSSSHYPAYILGYFDKRTIVVREYSR